MPSQRPDCGEILAMRNVEKRMRKYFSEADGMQREVLDLGPQLKYDLLQTIAAEKNIF
jgi:hypothetical protein